MQRITILPPENHVYIDGVSRTVDCAGISDSAAPSLTVHAVQWNGTKGWIEYVNDPFDATTHVANRRITDISQFQRFVGAWHAANPVG
jgi:hypothetical protein